jgi:prepilin-type N-terminal cleavage/methylation domain-containing protein
MIRTPSRQKGFTLIEIMIVVAIVAVLAAVALPNYRDYVLRGRLTEAIGGLSDARTKMEQYFADNRTYPTGGCVTSGTPSSTQILVQALQSFTLTCAATASTFTVTATGSGPTAGFVYTIAQDNTRSSTITGVSSAWNGTATCWVINKGLQC